jgi:hypothetical protein
LDSPFHLKAKKMDILKEKHHWRLSIFYLKEVERLH